MKLRDVVTKDEIFKLICGYENKSIFITRNAILRASSAYATKEYLSIN